MNPGSLFGTENYMRINDLFNNIQNTNSTGVRVNDDLSSFDGAFFIDKNSTPAVDKSSVSGTAKMPESRKVTGNTYTLNEAKGMAEREGLGEKLLNAVNAPRNNDKELVKNLTGEDYESLEDEGMSLEKFSKERLERAIERIKENRTVREIRLAEGVEKQQEYRETVDRMSFLAKADSGAEKLIAKMLYEADIPVTEENIEEVKKAADIALNTGKLNDSSENYLIRNNLPPTIENLYKAAHTGEMRQMPLDDASWESLKKTAIDIVKESGVDTDTGLKTARWLVEHDLPVTKENILYKTELDAYGDNGPLSSEEGFGAAVNSMQEGSSAKEGLVIVRKDEEAAAFEKEAEDIINKLPGISNEAIKSSFLNGATEENITIPELIDAEEQIEKTGNLNGTVNPGGMTKEEANVKIRLEEIRVSLNIEAARGLMAKGISIMSDGLMRVAEGIRELQKEFFEEVYRELETDYGFEAKGSSADKISASEAAELAVRTENGLEKVINAPLELYKASFSIRHSITLAQLSETGETLISENVQESSVYISVTPASMTAALTSYENSSTEVRRDLGDSIKKAFSGSVDSLLSSFGLETTEGNRRAVRILGYNSMEITASSIEEIKYYDAKVTGLAGKMTPPVVMAMIRNGINPLECTIDELDEAVSSIIKEQGSSPEQKYSEFLVRMEEAGAISQNERNAYIGIYRLLYNVEKNDGAAIGSLLASGRELTFGNLLTEERSRNTGIDMAADDNTDIKASYYKNSVSDQINDAFNYQRRLADEALEVTDPSRWDRALSGKDYQNVTIEGLHDGLYTGQTGTVESAGNDIETFASKADDIVKTMTGNTPVSEFLNSFGIKDSYRNRKAAEEIFFGENQEDSSISVTADELNSALESESNFDELLGIKTRRANALTGQAFKTAITAQAAAELNGRVERIEMLEALAGKGHYRLQVDEGETSKTVNLTVIKNTGDAGTVSVEIQREDYSLQADLNLVMTESEYSNVESPYKVVAVPRPGAQGVSGVPFVRGNILFMGTTAPDAAGKAEMFKTALKEAGINADNINISGMARNSEAYMSYLSGLYTAAQHQDGAGQASGSDRRSEETARIAERLYMAAKSFLSFF
jgi:hypothetical protein